MLRGPLKAKLAASRAGLTMKQAQSKALRQAAFRTTIPRGIRGPVRYGSSQYRRGGPLKTLDLRFSGAYNAAYTVDTEPLQVLNTNTNTACVQSITNIQQGTGESQRMGNKVSIKSIRLRLNLATTVINNGNMLATRFMVIYDRNPNGAYQAANTILAQYNSANVIVAGLPADDLDPNKMERYSVLMDKWVMLPPFEAAAAASINTTGPTVLDAMIIDRYIKCRDLECIYGATSNPGTIANSTVGSIQIISYGNAAPGSDPWMWQGHVRVRFHDA